MNQIDCFTDRSTGVMAFPALQLREKVGVQDRRWEAQSQRTRVADGAVPPKQTDQAYWLVASRWGG